MITPTLAGDVPVVRSDHASLAAYPTATLFAQDVQTGITVRVEQDGRHVAAFSATGSPLWRTEVIKENDSCVAGSPVVRHVLAGIGKITVTFCKHSYGEIDLPTGAYRFLGQD
jgi:hypothetical protein